MFPATSMYISSGATVTGSVSINQFRGVYPSVVFSSGAILNLDLTRTSPEADALVNCPYWDGTPTYTITVPTDPEPGIYTLINSIYGFKDTISVINTAGVEIGTLSVGQTVDIEDCQYILYDTYGDLELAINCEPPTGYNIQKDTVAVLGYSQ